MLTRLIFIDLKQAYENMTPIDCEWLWFALEWLRNLTVTSSRFSIKVGGSYSEEFKVKFGVYQADVLFLIFFDLRV